MRVDERFAHTACALGKRARRQSCAVFTSFYDGKRGTNTMTGLRAIRYNIVLFEDNYCVLKIFDGNRPIEYVTRERARVITAKYQSVLSAAVRLTKRRAARRLRQRSYDHCCNGPAPCARALSTLSGVRTSSSRREAR